MDETKPDLGHDMTIVYARERERHLEMCNSVGRSPSFVIQLDRRDEGEFDVEDYRFAARLRNLLIGEDGERNALDFIHHESESINLSGVVLAREGLQRFKRIVQALSGHETEGFADLRNEKYKFSAVMGIPEEGDDQKVTIIDGEYFTIYGSSVLALVRTPKELREVMDDVLVQQLPKPDDKEYIEGGKGTRVKSVDLGMFEGENYNWATNDQINGLPEQFFEKIDPEEIVGVEVEMGEYAAVKADINDSGLKIRQIALDLSKSAEEVREMVNERSLKVAANFKLLINAIQHIRAAADDGGEKVYFVNILGDSVVFFLPRKSAESEAVDGSTNYSESVSLELYKGIMKAFADQTARPDVFLQKGDEHTEKVHGQGVQTGERENVTRGHLSSIELPLEGKVRVYIAGNGRVLGFDKKWDKGLEMALEEYHKETGMRPSEIVSSDDSEFKRWQKLGNNHIQSQ